MCAEKQGWVLVTGGRGYVGRAVVKLLRRTGNRVISLDRSAADSVDNEIGCDVSNGDQVQGLFETSRIHGIVHLAAILPTAAQREPLLATQVNVYGSLHLL